MAFIASKPEGAKHTRAEVNASHRVIAHNVRAYNKTITMDMRGVVAYYNIARVVIKIIKGVSLRLHCSRLDCMYHDDNVTMMTRKVRDKLSFGGYIV